MSTPQGITELLVKWSDGDQTALDSLAPLVEKELHRLAHSYMQKERPGHMLQTTALVNEAFIRLVNQKRVRWRNRAHFYGIAAQIMRRILSNYARDQKRKKRGGGALHVSLSEASAISPVKMEEVLVIDEAIERLAAKDRRKSEMVVMRYFGGMSVEEIAEVLGVSVPTVERDWKFAQAWFAREIGSHE